ncbi:MAG: pyridoxamine 5'-phosphate oxidase family protein [Prevotellaceae bacterium]|jgi:general stress protein 26|nr:pyridoxamine 5'-phosphate oxidase family protein [Prevotellaceae bacterium]
MKNTSEYQQFIESLPIAYLTTIDAAGMLSTRALLNLRCKAQFPHMLPLHQEEGNPLTVFLTTNTSSDKMQEIAQNANACLYFCKENSFQGLLLQGKIEAVTDNALRQKAWIKAWEMYYPKGDSDYTLLRFLPETVKTYANFAVNKENVF